MKRFINYVFISSLLMFISILNVNAECSYKERKSMLDSAKLSEVYYEIGTEEREAYFEGEGTELEKRMAEFEYIKIVVTNVTDDFYIVVTNDNNDEKLIINIEDTDNGTYIIKKDFGYDIIKYNFEYFSKNSNCYGNSITSKKLTTPIYNDFHIFDICKNEKVSSMEYCKKYVEKDFNKTPVEIQEYLENLIKSDAQEKKDNSNINIFIYIIIFIISLVMVITLGIFYKKNRSRL